MSTTYDFYPGVNLHLANHRNKDAHMDTLMNIIASNVDETRNLFYLKVQFLILYTSDLVKTSKFIIFYQVHDKYYKVSRYWCSKYVVVFRLTSKYW